MFKGSCLNMTEKINNQPQKNTDSSDEVEIKLQAVIDGEIIKIENIQDPVFSSKMIGDGYGIIPTGEKVYSPIAGKVEEIAATGHAVYLAGENGLKLLIHLGIDTIKLKGEGFENKIEKGMTIQKNDLLINYDTEFIRNAGLDPVVSVVILEQKEKNMDLTVYPSKSAKANKSIAAKVKIYE